jgi:cell division transport system ATP-binding protein
VLRLQNLVVGQSAGDADGVAISFDMVAGGAHVLTGETGSGKTAMLEMIGLARTPARGGLQLFGQDVARVPRPARHMLRRRIGMIFQDLKLVDDLSADDNVALAVQAAGRGGQGVATEIAEVMSWVGLGQRRQAMAGALDDEGRRRLALARAVINRPDLVIADEPAGKTGQAILALLADLNQAGTAILLATRDGALAANAGAEVTHLSRARTAAGARL